MLKLPNDVAYILDVLHNNGFTAYVVGGCVRDSILGETPHDWDITTSAKPDEVSKLFRKVIPSGLSFGTVTVRLHKNSYEVTTYRSEGRYTDGRHPDAVSFEETLEEDVKRRDLTINAIAYNQREGFVDLVGGISDLQNGIIRFVGNPYDRLNEDPLRALRAVRFAARYNFVMSEETKEACLSVYGSRHDCVSAERVHDEIFKFFSGRRVKEPISLELLDVWVNLLACNEPILRTMMGVTQHSKYHLYDVYEHSLRVLQYTTTFNNAVLSMAALLHDIGKPRVKTLGKDGYEHFLNHARESVSIARNVLADLRFSKDESRDILYLVGNHDIFCSGYKLHKVRKFLAGRSLEDVNALLTLKRADSSAQNPEYVDSEYEEELKRVFYQVLEDGSNITLRELQINGDDILAIGIQDNINIKKVLEACLLECYVVPSHNNREFLLNFASGVICRNNY